MSSRRPDDMPPEVWAKTTAGQLEALNAEWAALWQGIKAGTIEDPWGFVVGLALLVGVVEFFVIGWEILL